jgi:hypothetical protein
MTRQLRTHPYVPDPAVPADPYAGTGYCAPPCCLPQRHPRHTLPDRTEAAAEQRRRLGESED